MTLAAAQTAFLAQVLDEDAPVPPRWSARERAGMTIYRSAYRARLVGALGETFPAVKAWVGEEAFQRAAAHHAIVNPPSGWSLDHFGDGFDETLADLFAGDPEVAELGWLEWHMHLAFVARDTTPLDQPGFAQLLANLAPEEIPGLRIVTMPGVAARTVRHDCAAIWTSAMTGSGVPDDRALPGPVGLVVWRESFRPVFRLASIDEPDCLSLATFGEMCALLAERRGANEAVAAAGTMLARWIDDGLIETIGPLPSA